MELTGALAQVPLGRSGVQVTRLGLGTAPLAGMYDPVPEGQALQVLTAAWDHGVRLFDTAPHYGAGSAECRVGKALSSLPRESFVLSSKVGRVLRPGADAAYRQVFPEADSLHPVFDFSRRGIRESFDASCERLGVDRLDVVHLHDPDDHVEQALTQALPELRELRRHGRIGALSAGTNHSGVLTRLVREVDLDCVLVAGRYSLLDQSAARDLFPACLERGTAVMLGGVFNGGLLADPGSNPRYDYAPAPESVLSRARLVAGLCDAHDVPVAAAALQFAFAHPAVTTVLVGMRSVTELETNVRLLSLPIPQALWGALRATGVLDPTMPIPS